MVEPIQTDGNVQIVLLFNIRTEQETSAQKLTDNQQLNGKSLFNVPFDAYQLTKGPTKIFKTNEQTNDNNDKICSENFYRDEKPINS
ncbi:hypothetical protein T08_13473 [Trichinella sp. T8]|nr:hypothetical protein T05_13085 [Trichinella murrelli]KRZ84963.1 hypothetical protein T08_13473 [Trichinella sp. T8]